MAEHAHVTRFAAETATALVTLALGVAIAIGAREYGTGWTTGGPEPGAFPFYVGLLVIAGSAGNLFAAWRKRAQRAPFLDAAQARRIVQFGLPMLAFVALAVTLGFYVATALYLCAVMRFQGGYRWPASIAVAAGASAFFFLLLETWFKVPLLKGPLEAALRLH
jgi:hypothetical protein